MAKLKHIIKQLTDEDYQAIYNSLSNSSAEKSAFLLKALRERSLSDQKVMKELDVNSKAYYTLRSRLNQKIEEYLLVQMESPRTDLLKKVANINEVLFTKKHAIAVATLKKLEKELLDYDLSNELTIVYKTLKKLHINSPESFNYSQLYNKHVAYMLSVDKAEDLLASYFQKFGVYALTGDETEKIGLKMLSDEIDNTTKLYQSHRLYVYQNALSIFHRLFVEEGENPDDGKEPIEDIIDQIERTFEQYHLDPIYHHLRLLFTYLRLEYYNYYKVYRKAEKFFEDINEDVADLLSHYGLYTFPALFLNTKIERHLRMETEGLMYEENEHLFDNFECNKDDIPLYVMYTTYRAISCYYAEKYEEAAKWINNLLNDVTFKRYPAAMLELKALLALQYCCIKDFELFNQLVNSIQRQIRIQGKESCENIILFIKILKTALSETKTEKADRVRHLSLKFTSAKDSKLFSPTRYIRFDRSFLERVV